MSLTRAATAALGWSCCGAGLRVCVQFGAGIVLARMLGPRAFGLAAASWALVGVGSQFMDLGFGSALIQRNEIADEDIRFVFTAQVAAGVALAAVFAGFAGDAARILGDADLAPAIRLLSFAPVAQALGQTAFALLRRELRFQAAQFAQLAGAVTGYGCVAIPLAAAGAGLSLIWGQLAQIAVSGAIAYACVRHPLRPRLTPARRMVGFGLRATAVNTVNWTIASLDNLAMSRAFGLGATGFFNRAQSVALAPAANLTQVLQSVLFPAYSRRADDNMATRRAYLASVSALAFVLLPASATMLGAPSTIVNGLYGEEWMPAAALLRPLAIAMPFQALLALSGPLLWARDRIGREFRAQAAALILFAALLAMAMRSGPPAVCWSVCAVSIARAVPVAATAIALAGVSVADCRRILRGPAALALTAGVPALICEHLRLGALELFCAVLLALSFTLALFFRWFLSAELLEPADRFIRMLFHHAAAAGAAAS